MPHYCVVPENYMCPRLQCARDCNVPENCFVPENCIVSEIACVQISICQRIALCSRISCVTDYIAFENSLFPRTYCSQEFLVLENGMCPRLQCAKNCMRLRLHYDQYCIEPENYIDPKIKLFPRIVEATFIQVIEITWLSKKYIHTNLLSNQ